MQKIISRIADRAPSFRLSPMIVAALALASLTACPEDESTPFASNKPPREPVPIKAAGQHCEDQKPKSVSTPAQMLQDVVTHLDERVVSGRASETEFLIHRGASVSLAAANNGDIGSGESRETALGYIVGAGLDQSLNEDDRKIGKAAWAKISGPINSVAQMNPWEN